jgi:hypothetical protein
MKTAVEWLVDEHFGGIENCTLDFKNKINQAKEMEREQIEDAFYHGVELTKIRVESIIDEADFEYYYNDTFEQ